MKYDMAETRKAFLTLIEDHADNLYCESWVDGKMQSDGILEGLQDTFSEFDHIFKSKVEDANIENNVGRSDLEEHGLTMGDVV